MATTPQNRIALGRNLEIAGLLIIRYGLVLIFLWIGLLKFLPFEAKAIEPLVAHSPFMSWMLSVFGVQGTSNVIGVIELITAILIAVRPWSAIACAIGSAMAVITSLLTLSFILSTPGWEPAIGFPALSPIPGQFLLKDILILGGGLWSLGESLKAVYGYRNGNSYRHSNRL
ncbi:DUF417 family protein [Leptolyngbya sp. FACHB-17]|uniref:YkgB family protein n=1 Tax=unclassified Leptolyngbya TaxID=2650499 RepID=UPI001680C87E|nr:DUF417 family protein [Leptolyngbya sp. FACHB-17]MBD2080191.1 DUF417 family protein [Leptolyngbya sp. FACHB-17]